MSEYVKFNLKWNAFHSKFSKCLESLRDEEYLHDVTLVCDDNFQVSANKLVLTACSNFFKNIFKINAKSESNIILCLDGVSSFELSNLMQYMYSGEVQILQEDIETFLALAQRFQLEGLTEYDHDGDEEKKYKMTTEERNLRNKKIDTKDGLKDIAIEDHQTDEAMEDNQTTVQNIASSKNIIEIDAQINENVEKCSDGRYQCKMCGKISKQKINLKNHIETHIEGLSFGCQLCGKTFRSRESIRTHKTRFHK